MQTVNREHENPAPEQRANLQVAAGHRRDARLTIRLLPCNICKLANELWEGWSLGEQSDAEHLTAGTWAKRCYFAGRALMDATLRPYDLGSTQWYVLWHLTNFGPTVQRDLGRALELERATLSGIVATLVRKDLLNQSSSGEDQRQRLLTLTTAGETLWRELPDLSFIYETAFGGIDEADLITTIRVLQSATERLQNLLRKE